MSRSQQLKKQIAELSGMIESFRTGRYNPDAWAGADMRRGREADRDFRNQERNVGLEHEKNNIQISINGKAWKVIPGKGYADSREEREYLNNMKKWAERKSAATNKQWTVYLTGANPSNESMSEGGEIDKSHGSPYDRGAADSWYNRRYNPHKVVDGKEIPCETPEEKMAYSQGWKDNEDAGGHKDYREGVAEGWKGGAIGGAVSALAGPEAIPVGMAVGDKVGDWVGGKDMDEGTDTEGGMAKQQLITAAKLAIKLAERMDSDTQLDAWVQTKISLASDYIETVFDFLVHGEQDVDKEVETDEEVVPGITHQHRHGTMKSTSTAMEGAKVDRQAKHITKSMMKARPGMSKSDAEGAAWAHIKHPKKKKKMKEDAYDIYLEVMLGKTLGK